MNSFRQSARVHGLRDVYIAARSNAGKADRQRQQQGADMRPSVRVLMMMTSCNAAWRGPGRRSRRSLPLPPVAVPSLAVDAANRPQPERGLDLLMAVHLVERAFCSSESCHAGAGWPGAHHARPWRNRRRNHLDEEDLPLSGFFSEQSASCRAWWWTQQALRARSPRPCARLPARRRYSCTSQMRRASGGCSSST